MFKTSTIDSLQDTKRHCSTTLNTTLRVCYFLPI